MAMAHVNTVNSAVSKITTLLITISLLTYFYFAIV